MCNGANCMHRTKLNLRAALSPDHLAAPDDILDTKKTLMALGYYRPVDGTEPGAWVDTDLFTGIRQFQRDNGLKVDALMRPGGPTEQAMNAVLEDAPPPPPANDDQPPAHDNGSQTALLNCDSLLGRDRRICDSLATRQLSAICHGSAMSRYSNCLVNRPLGPLTTRP